MPIKPISYPLLKVIKMQVFQNFRGPVNVASVMGLLAEHASCFARNLEAHAFTSKTLRGEGGGSGIHRRGRRNVGNSLHRKILV